MAVQTAATTTQRPKEVHGMNDRVRRLREESLNTQPRIYIERAVLETEAYEIPVCTCCRTCRRK